MNDRSRRADWVAVVPVLLLALWVFAPFFADVGAMGFQDWDSQAAYRYVTVLALKHGQLPWWNPWAVGGQPFLTDPVQSVLMPDTLAIVMFGSVIGFKVIILLYQLAGYEGSRRLCRHLYGDRPFVRAVSVIPVILPALALHFYPCLLYTSPSPRDRG